jgi:hypothetical protein
MRSNTAHDVQSRKQTASRRRNKQADESRSQNSSEHVTASHTELHTLGNKDIARLLREWRRPVLH